MFQQLAMVQVNTSHLQRDKTWRAGPRSPAQVCSQQQGAEQNSNTDGFNEGLRKWAKRPAVECDTAMSKTVVSHRSFEMEELTDTKEDQGLVTVWLLFLLFLQPKT